MEVMVIKYMEKILKSIGICTDTEIIKEVIKEAISVISVQEYEGLLCKYKTKVVIKYKTNKDIKYLECMGYRLTKEVGE